MKRTIINVTKDPNHYYLHLDDGQIKTYQRTAPSSGIYEDLVALCDLMFRYIGSGEDAEDTNQQEDER